MWAYGQHLRVERIDKRRQTQDSCIIASFRQQSRASTRETNLIDDELGYVGTIVGIYEVDYRVCKRVIYVGKYTKCLAYIISSLL